MAKGRKKKTKKILICEYCGIEGTNKTDLKRCHLCRKLLCIYHRKPQAHACEAVDWEELEAGKTLRAGDMSLIDLLKAGAFVMVVILLVKMVLGMFSGLRSGLGKFWGIIKAGAAVFVAVPLLLLATTMIFPDGAGLLNTGVATLSNAVGLDSLQVELPQMPKLEVNPLGGLKGCTIAIRYSSALETYHGQKCIEVCSERGYPSYGIVENSNSIDCYCCYGY